MIGTSCLALQLLANALTVVAVGLARARSFEELGSDPVIATTLDAVQARMNYARVDYFWQETHAFGDQKPFYSPSDGTERYLLFDFDDGGLNNIRIGWEMAAVAAVESNRTLVWPPRTILYLLPAEPSGLDYFLDMPKFKAGLRALPLSSFIQREGERLGVTSEMMAWAKLYESGAEVQDNIFPKEIWAEFRSQKFTSTGDEASVCELNTYRKADRIMFTSPEEGRVFGCGNWPNVGEPRFTDDHAPWLPPEWVYRLLRNHFVWHPDAFEIASHVVNYLGIFNYVGLHARYGDFQFQNKSVTGETLLKQGWLSFLEVNSDRAKRDRHLYNKGLRDVGLIRAWVEDQKRPVYIATDQNSDAYFQPFEDAGIRTVSWRQLVEQAKQGEGPLTPVLQKYSSSRIENFAGLVEQLICTYSRVFIGSEKSTFTGYIERMRLYAQAPTHATFVRYAGMYASDKGERLFHGDPRTEKIQASVSDALAAFDSRGGTLNRDDPGALPTDAL